MYSTCRRLTTFWFQQQTLSLLMSVSAYIGAAAPHRGRSARLTPAKKLLGRLQCVRTLVATVAVDCRYQARGTRNCYC